MPPLLTNLSSTVPVRSVRGDRSCRCLLTVPSAGEAMMKNNDQPPACYKSHISFALGAALTMFLFAVPGSTQAKPPPLTLHHLQVSVADAESLAQWYVDKLGFKVVKRAAAGTTKVVWIDIPGFRIGLAQVPGSARAAAQEAVPPADLKFQGYKQIHFSVPSVDEAYRSLQADGVKFLVPPTSYTPPGIRLASFQDPEGNIISLYEDLDPANALMPLSASAAQTAALARVKAFVVAHNRHDLEAALAFYADDAEFQLNGGRVAVHGVAQIRELESFDVFAGSHVEPRGLTARTEGGNVVISIAEVVEHSRIFQAVGLPTVTTASIDRAFVVRSDGRFAFVAQPEFAAACREILTPAFSQSIAWLRETRDARAGVLSNNGKLHLTAATVPAMIAAITDWRRATGWSPDPDLAARCAKVAR